MNIFEKLYMQAEEDHRNTVQWSVDDNGSITVNISHLVKTDAFKQTIEDFASLENNLNKSS